MKLLLVSEGKHELRDLAQRGALRVFVERLLPSPACEIETRKVSDPAIIVEKGKGNGMLKRFIAWLKYAAKHQFDAIVLVIDEDGDTDRLKAIEDAQLSTLVPIQRALGLAIRSFDAWILADETAMTSVLGIPIGRQRDMETILDPKQLCRKLCADKFSLTDFYAKVAEIAILADLESRLPRGFAPFANRVRALKLP